MHRRSHSERGQNLVEFALLTPFVIAFLAIIVMVGLALHGRASLQQAVREGARQAAVGASLTDVQDLAAANAPNHLEPADIHWCHPVGATSGTQGKVGDPVRVYIEIDGEEGFPFKIVPTTGILAAIGVSPITVQMEPRGTARLEKSVTSPVNCPT
jgi:hypothetical protein